LQCASCLDRLDENPLLSLSLSLSFLQQDSRIKFWASCRKRFVRMSRRTNGTRDRFVICRYSKRARADSSIAWLGRAIKCRAHAMLSNIIIAIMQVHRNLHELVSARVRSRGVTCGQVAPAWSPPRKKARPQPQPRRSRSGKPEMLARSVRVNERNLIGSFIFTPRLPPISAFFSLAATLSRSPLLLLLLSLSLAASVPPIAGIRATFSSS
jgi:hypothetical protein